MIMIHAYGIYEQIGHTYTHTGRPVSVVVEDTLSSYYGNYWVLVTSSTAYIDTYVVGFTTCATWDCFGPGSRPYADTLEFRLEPCRAVIGPDPSDIAGAFVA